MGSMGRKWRRAPVKREEMRAYLQNNFNGFGRQLAKGDPLRIAVAAGISTFLTLAVVALYLLGALGPRLSRIEARQDQYEAQQHAPRTR